jgi:hypothetical protein
MKMRAAPTAENVKPSNADDGASDTFVIFEVLLKT